MNREVMSAGEIARAGRGVVGGGRHRKARGGKEDWIGDQLRQVYDEALLEAIPDDMLALLNRLDGEKEGGGRS